MVVHDFYHLESYKGTAPFMPPEKSHQEKKTDPKKGDIYSIGVMIYYMLYNRFPTLEFDKDKTDKDWG